MGLQTLMVHVDDSSDAMARVRLAMGLATDANALLIGGSSVLPPPPFVAEGVMIDQWPDEDTLRELREVIARRRRRFEGIVGDGKPEHAWRSALEDPHVWLAREARAADMVVIGRDRPAGELHGLDPGRALLQLGRPALVVPPGVEALPKNHAVIAWSDTREARRAVADAVALLPSFTRVTLLGIRDATETARDAFDNASRDVAAYLGRHGIAVTPVALDTPSMATGPALIAESVRLDADLIIAGAFGRTRLSEWVFGGVTHSLLEKAPVCCLMAH